MLVLKTFTNDKSFRLADMSWKGPEGNTTKQRGEALRVIIPIMHGTYFHSLPVEIFIYSRFI
jgi:hypothetical protein